jgi:large subunit ribosomal protein L29
MEFVDIKQKNVKDLQTLLMEKREELRELRFKVSEKQLKDVRSIREIKKAIAQILTLINQKREKTTNK